MKKTITFNQLKKLVKEKTADTRIKRACGLDEVAEYFVDAIANYFEGHVSSEPDKYGFAFDLNDGSFLDFVAYWGGAEYRLSELDDLGNNPLKVANKIIKKYAGSLPLATILKIDRNGSCEIAY